MNDYGSDNPKINARQRHDRYRDGIIWGAVASLSLFLMNPYTVFPKSLIFAAFAGYRGKSIRPALGTSRLVAPGALRRFILRGIAGLQEKGGYPSTR